jgi:hypothetical protein
MIKSKRIRWARDVAYIGQKRNAEYLKQQDYASDLRVDRKIYIYALNRCKWYKVGVNWIHLAVDKDKCHR